jgi:hypothetical protein
MTRSGLAVDSQRRPLSWAIVAATFLAYLGLLVVAGMAGLPLNVPLPWWVAQLAPPLLYAVLVFVVTRPRSATSLCGGALLLWAVHLLLGMLTAPIVALLASSGGSATTWSFPPAPLPQLLWVPVLLVPLRDLLKGRPVRRSADSAAAAARRSVPATRTPPLSAPTPAGRVPVEHAASVSVTPGKALFGKPTMVPTRPGATTVTSMVTSVETRSEAPRPPVAAPAAATSDLTAADGEASAAGNRTAGAAAPASAAEPADTAPSDSQRRTAELLARETSEEPLRVSTMRVLAQLPAEALAVPADRLATELGAQPSLLVPRRLVLAQLGDGIVRASWDLVAPQIPSHLLAMSHEAIKAALPDGQCVLPLDEIVRQFAPDIFLSAGPAPDVRGIEEFSAPFQPLEIRAESSAASELEVMPAPMASAPVEVARLDDVPEIVSLTEAPASPPDPIDTHRRVAPIVAPPVPVALLETIPRAPVLQIQVEEGAERPAAKPARRGSALQGDDAHLLRELTALLPAAGLLVFEVRAVDGVTLFSATSPAVDDEVVLAASALLLPLIAPARTPWPVDQVTLRGSRAVLILTPLGPLSAGGPVLAAAVPPGGGIALLELRCREAAAAHCARAGLALDLGAAPGDDRDEPDLLDVEPSTRTREIASSLGALGAVTASSLRAPETERALYLFLPAGSDARAIGALAHDVSSAMRQAAEVGVTFRTAVLRSGARRIVIRLLAGRSDTIVAAGETARPGLAYRQVERAAATLGSV